MSYRKKERAPYWKKDRELPCEMCLKEKACAAHESVCRACDAQMKAEQQPLIKARAKAHADKYKCQDCGKGLPEHRRLKCDRCMQLPTEDAVWERVETYGKDWNDDGEEEGEAA